MFHFLEKKPNGEEEDHKEIFEKIQAQPARGSKSSMAASSNHYYNGKPNQRNEDSCPPLQLLTNNCSSLGEYLPQDSLRQMLRHACNWYDVCYACGKTFGLTLDKCDEGFLEESSALCRDDQPCKTITRFFLQPLRNTKVLFKRSVAQLCYTDRCVEEFLKWHYINNPIN
ncbi:uncharacterized protein LOC143249738 [Tachypleus tridentatus]|uniref:uncharacterized protein LOC143249738 n=1 Tax=Tachypleus tridentatus TaxID=6853 RepID=UPI003FD20871